MNDRYDSVVVDIITRLMIPIIQLYGVYVLIHGHYSPGGGFQAGALLAAGVLVSRISFGHEESRRLFPEIIGPVAAGIGILIYFLTGAVSLFFGGTMLDYSYLPLPGYEGAALRSEGILLVEVGVTFAVAGVLISIYDHLTNAGTDLLERGDD